MNPGWTCWAIRERIRLFYQLPPKIGPSEIFNIKASLVFYEILVLPWTTGLTSLGRCPDRIIKINLSISRDGVVKSRGWTFWDLYRRLVEERTTTWG